MKKLVYSGLMACLCATGSTAHELTFNSTVTYSSTQPAGGAENISNWNGAAFDADNIGGSGVNADGGADNGAANDGTTYVAGNQPRQGQTFTTGSNPNGYELNAVTVRMAGYTNNNATGANQVNWNLHEHNGPLQIEIGKVSGTDVSTLSKQMFIMGRDGNPGAGNSANGPGTYITFELPFTMVLEPSTTYSFDFWIGNGCENYFEWLGTQSNEYTEGTAYTREWFGGPITPVTGERVFQLDLTALSAPAPTFAHPGTLHTEADFDRMKAKIAAGEEPWVSGYNMLLSSPYNNLGWPAYDVDWIVRGVDGSNYTRCQQDAQLIYTLTLLWKLTGNTAYADRAVYIANVWSDLYGCTGNSNLSLAAGICGYLFAISGEMLTTYPGWPEAEQQAYKDMMMRAFYPANLDFLWRAHDTFWREGGNTHYRLNWETCNMASMAAIGILCDNRAVYEQAIDYFKYGSGSGRIERAAWYVHADGTAQTEEIGRDQGHNNGGWYSMALLCQMAWNQGDDLWAYDDNRVLRAMQHTVKWNLWQDVPVAFHSTCDSDMVWAEGLSWAGRGELGIFNELVYNHYVNVKGMAAPYNETAAAIIRPEPWPDTGIHGSQVDWFGHGTLVFTQDPVAAVPPSSLKANWSKNRILLNWMGSARATGYNIKRATTQGGPYTVIGTAGNMDLNFTDTNVVNGATYYYVVSADISSGETEDSAELAVEQELARHYTFEGNANDVVGGQNGELKGGSTGLPQYAAGFGGGQAIHLDGIDDYVQLPVGVANYEDITIATWVYWYGGWDWQRVFDFGTEIEKSMFLTPSDGGRMKFQITTSRGLHGTGSLSGPVMPVGQWTHVAVTLNGDVGTFYVNGAPVDTQIIDLVDPLFGQVFCYLGRSMYNNDPLFSGRIDDFRIYNHALSGDEVYTLWGQSANNPPVFSADPIDLTLDEDVSLSQSLSATDSDGGGLNYSKLLGPNWMTVNSDGTLSGTPTNDEVGDHYFVVRVADASGATDDAVLRVHVNNINDAPVWDSDPFDGGGVALGDTYSMSVGDDVFDVDAGDAITISKTNGPAWLSVAGDGTLSGTAGSSDAGTNLFTLRATDLSGAYSNVLFTVVVQPRELCSHYAFENNLIDQVGGYDGTHPGSAVYGAGESGQGLALDGTNDYVSLPAGVASYQNLTIATWIYWNGGDDWQRIFDFGSGTAEYLFLTPSGADGNLQFTINDGTAEEIISAGAFPTGQWIHVTITLEETVGKIYVDGLLRSINSDMAISPVEVVQDMNYLGKSQWPDPLFHGMLDEFYIYNHALGAEEIAALAGVTLPTDSTVAYWTFEEGTADAYVPYSPGSAGQFDGSMLDVSGNGNHLSAWAADWEWYRGDAPASVTPQTGMTNSLSIQHANDFNAMSAIGTSLTFWNPTNWTIEAAFKTDRTDSFETIVGRDSYGAYSGWPELSVLYLSVRPEGVIAISFTDNAGNNWVIDSATGVVEANQWQAVAAVSDGSTLSLYLKNITAAETNYTLMGTLDISGSADPALSKGAGDGGFWDAGVITVGRGLYDGGHTDRFFGYIDDVRLSGSALSTNQFLYSTPLPPAAPDVAAVSGDAQVSLSWNAVTGASGYAVKSSTDAGGPYTVIDTPGSTSYLHAGLTNGTVYYYVISSVGAGGESTNSVEVSAVPSVAISSEEFFITEHTVEDGTNLLLTVLDSVPGHLYGILATDSLTPPNWSNIVIDAGTGSNILFSLPITSVNTNRYFKLDVQRW